MLAELKYDSIDEVPAETIPAAGVVWSGAMEEARFELQLRAVAIPIALLGAWTAVHVGLFHMLMRTALTMWLHESGHAVTAWFCGLPAIPLPWKTPTAETRSPVFAAVIAAVLVALALRSWLSGDRLLAGVCGGLLVIQGICTLASSLQSAHALVTFDGDAGAMVLGSLLMATVYSPPGSVFYQGWLRWGFLIIGAAAFADVFDTWWSARSNRDRIPFGENEGVGLSDPSRLVEWYGWTIPELVGRYIAVGVACLALLGVAYVVGLVRARAQLRAAL
jgi:ABC-type amino acid transport system permease subunit